MKIRAEINNKRIEKQQKISTKPKVDFLKRAAKLTNSQADGLRRDGEKEVLFY